MKKGSMVEIAKHVVSVVLWIIKLLSMVVFRVALITAMLVGGTAFVIWYAIVQGLKAFFPSLVSMTPTAFDYCRLLWDDIIHRTK